MQVGPGTVVASRYSLTRRIEDRRGGQRWQAIDAEMDREVTLLLVPVSHPKAAALLDAAARTSNLADLRLIRVLASGRDARVVYVVEEHVPSALSLGEAVAGGRLPAEEVRRIVGEVATALDTVAQQGLHHLDISPAAVIVGADTRVALRGVATQAALAGLDDEVGDPRGQSRALRSDTVHLVALLYVGMTGRWPLPGYAGGLDRAPRTPRGVPKANEIAADVPADLNVLCTICLTDNAGPSTPGELMRSIAPWSSARVTSVKRLAPTPGATQPPELAVPDSTPVTEPPPEPQSVSASAPETTAAEAMMPKAEEAPAAHPDLAPQDLSRPDPAPTPESPTENPPEAIAEHSDAAAGPPAAGPPAAGPPAQGPAAPSQSSDDPDGGHTEAVPAETPDEQPSSPTDSIETDTDPREPSELTAPSDAPIAAPHSPEPESPTVSGDEVPERPSLVLPPLPERETDHKPASPQQADLGHASEGPVANLDSAAPTPDSPLAVTPPTAPAEATLPGDGLPNKTPTEFADPTEAVTPASAAVAAATTAVATVSALAKRSSSSATNSVGRLSAAVGRGARQTADRVNERAATLAAERREYLDTARAIDERHRVRLDQTRVDLMVESPAPGLPASAGLAPSPHQANVVLGIVAACLFVALIFGAIGVSRIGANTDLAAIMDGRTKRDTSTGQQLPSPSPSGSESAGNESYPIMSATGYDPPPGDGAEHNSQAPWVFDNNPETVWTSEAYNDPGINGKPGVGVVTDLGQERPVRNAVLTLPTTQDVSVYVGNTPDKNAMSLVGGSSGKSGTVSITSQEAHSGRFVIVWFTSLTQDGDGRFRAKLGELEVR